MCFKHSFNEHGMQIWLFSKRTPNKLLAFGHYLNRELAVSYGIRSKRHNKRYKRADSCLYLLDALHSGARLGLLSHDDCVEFYRFVTGFREIDKLVALRKLGLSGYSLLLLAVSEHP